LKELHNLLAEYFITKTKSLAELLFTVPVPLALHSTDKGGFTLYFYCCAKFREKLCIDWQQENVWNNFLHLLQLSGVSSPTLDRLRFCSASAAVFSNDIRNGSDTELVWREDKKISLPSRRNPSRTTIQKLNANWGRRRKPSRWTKEESNTLIALFEKYQHLGRKVWSRISKSLKSRTAAQCAQRWKRVVDPNINKGKWSAGLFNDFQMLTKRTKAYSLMVR
jgi:hypothetical protein